MDVISFVNQSAFYFGAIIIIISCLVFTLIHRNMEKPQTGIFVGILWISFFTCVFNMIAMYIEPCCKYYRSAQTTLHVSHYLYFLAHNLIPLFLCYYTFFATQAFTRIGRNNQILYVIPFAVSELFVITNPFNHYTWYYDVSYNFHRGFGEISIFVSGIFYYLVALYYLMFRWYAATKKRRLMITVSFLMTAIGVIIQVVLPELEIELFFESITFLGIMLAIEYDDDRVDTVTRMYNRDAFIQDVRYYYDTHTQFHAVLLKLTNCETYQKMPDSYDLNEVYVSTAIGLRRIFSYQTCYRVTPSSFILLALKKDEEYADKLAAKVNQFLRDGLRLPKKDERITGVVLEVKAPEEISSVQDLLLMCEMEYYDVTSFTVVKGTELHELFDRAELERAIRMGIKENRFEVLYQLVYNTKDNTVFSAEALIRLNDPNLKTLMPADFIPAAERNGMIDIIGDFVLRKACHFVKSEKFEKLGMKCVNINLSVLQCMQMHFVEQITNIVREEKVDPSKIQFEITESVAAEDYNYLARIIKECREIGFHFSMEGYGLGYSNIYSVFALDFDEIKLDKTLLWEADNSDQGRIILENSINMIHELGLPVVAVGVETKEQLDRLEKLDVEYVQGFYFARPESEEEISKRI